MASHSRQNVMASGFLPGARLREQPGQAKVCFGKLGMVCRQCAKAANCLGPVVLLKLPCPRDGVGKLHSLALRCLWREDGATGVVAGVVAGRDHKNWQRPQRLTVGDDGGKPLAKVGDDCGRLGSGACGAVDQLRALLSEAERCRYARVPLSR